MTKSPIKVAFKEHKNQPVGLITMDLDGSIAFQPNSYQAVARALVDPSIAHIQMNNDCVHATIRKQWIATNDQDDLTRQSASRAADMLFGRTRCAFTVQVIANDEKGPCMLAGLRSDGTRHEWAFHYGAFCSLLDDDGVAIIEIVDETGAHITIQKKWVATSKKLAA